ncbi:unnamed protein product [Anisakis simplex]|uniref:SLC12 domain-containing protein n=1 Tax=Anisakis simplex TaxID=6269 RepID=A0A0M3JMF9_ANISI|nr:unnamed protein product [Anisakis simplex]
MEQEKYWRADTTINPSVNNLIRSISSNADLVLVNLPRARQEATTASRLLLSLDVIGDHLPRLIAFRAPIKITF